MIAKTAVDARDAARWDAVEEATERLQEDRREDALVALRDVLRADASNHYAYHYLGVAFYEIGNKEAARDAYRAAVRLAPDYLGARVALSNTLREIGELDAALSEAREALRRFPKDPDALYAAGLAHAAKGNRAAARRELNGFLASNPEFEVASEVRGILEMLGIGDDDEPIEFE